MSAQHTPGTWKPGKPRGTVVSDQPLPNYNINGGHDDVAHYGGHLIAESIWRAEDAHLIAAAPDLLAVAEAALWEDDGLSCADALRAAIAKAKGKQQ